MPPCKDPPVKPNDVAAGSVKPASSTSLPERKLDELQGVPLKPMNMDKEPMTAKPGIDGKIDKSEMDKIDKFEMDKIEKCVAKNAANRDVLALMELKPEVGFVNRGVKKFKVKDIWGSNT